MLADQAQILSDSRDVTRALHKRAFGDDFMPSEDDTNIHIGDITNQPVATNNRPQTRGIHPLVGGLIGAGLMAVGGPLALLAWNAIQKPAAPVAAPSLKDTDTQYEIRLLP